MTSKMPFFIASFLGAFLLFQQELIIGKILLPIYGGGFQVWITCLAYFLSLLCLGYIYSDVISRNFSLKRYRYFHIFLTLVAIVSLPHQIKTVPLTASPIFEIVLSLFLTLTPTFFLLACNGNMIQSWYARTNYPDSERPFFLYSASNWGSLLGLITFPFFFEFFFKVKTLWMIWYILYAIFVINLFLSSRQLIPQKLEAIQKKVSASRKVTWFSLSALCNALMLTTTKITANDIGNHPLLWIIPIAIYLITLILNFKRKHWYPKHLNVVLISLLVISVAISFTKLQINTWLLSILSDYIILFLSCMYCHRLLFIRKPKCTGRITSYYVYIALGGAVGSVLIGIILPIVFTYGKAIQVEHYTVIAGIIAICLILNENLSKNRKLMLSAFTLYLIFSYFYFSDKYSRKHGIKILHSKRSFYGSYYVKQKDKTRTLVSGTTIHGVQIMQKEFLRTPLKYFHFKAPIGDIFNVAPNAQDVALIGLGIGSLLEHSKPNQQWDIFEIDPEVVEIANDYFAHLSNAKAELQILIGDGRVNLNKITNFKYDLLIIDAFNSDSIPTHLLTKEAIKLYFNKIKSDGVIAIHISNRYFNLKKMLNNLTSKMNIPSAYKYKEFQITEQEMSRSTWYVLANSKKIIDHLIANQGWKTGLNSGKSEVYWTDDHSNILPFLRITN